MSMAARRMKIAVPDLISNSYFPAAAAVELGCFAAEGIDIDLELIFPVNKCYEALRDGTIDFVGGSAHSALAAFPEWQGVKLIAAQGQGMYWFLVMRQDLGIERGDLDALRGRRIGAAPWVDMGLRQLLIDAGHNPENEAIDIAPVPMTTGAGVNFGLAAAKALEEGKIDGFWANGMGTEVALKRGVGSVVLDIRRGDGPKGCFNFTMASVATSDRLIAENPRSVAAAVRAIAAAQQSLKEDVTRATHVGQRLFPAYEANLIAGIVARDLPFYDATIGRDFVEGMNAFARARGLLRGNPAYEDVVATEFSCYWER